MDGRIGWSYHLAVSGRRWLAVMAAGLVATAVGVSLATAGGFVVFRGISAAQHPRTRADRLDSSVLASIASTNKQVRLHHISTGLLVADSSRFIRQFGGGERVYAVAATGGFLCTLVERLPNAQNPKRSASDWGCTRGGLTRTLPTTISSFRANEKSSFFSWGIARDGVTAVSWTMAGRVISVPVRHNAWAYTGASAFSHSAITVHFADGRTQKIP